MKLKQRIGIILALVTAAIIIYALLAHQYMDFILRTNTIILQQATRWGLLGAFVVAAVASGSILIQIPYPTVIFVLASPGTTLNLLALTIMTGLGMSVGELLPYAIGRWLSRPLVALRKNYLAWVDRYVTQHPRTIPWLIFLFAATPLPDDVLLILLGIQRYSLKKIILPLVIGKLLMAVGLVYGAHAFSTWKPGLVEESILLVVLVIVALIIGLSIGHGTKTEA